jgi:tRNA G10  N-methylase Trm11
MKWLGRALSADLIYNRAMTKFSHLAILGRQPELGLVELESRLGAPAVEPWGRWAALMQKDLPLSELGGVIKLGRVLYQGPAVDVGQVPFDWKTLAPGAGKTVFALSYYGLKATPRFVLATGLQLKKQLREHGPVRFVTPTEGTAVGAAALHHNGIPETGFELLVVIQGQQMVVAVTTAVQDIDWYSKRDYDRPARSAKVGMLPPKLAQVLVNTTQGSLVVDPFCGTGVVLQEALLMGRTAVGSDLAPDMVSASRANLAWLAPAAGRELLPWHVEQADARTVQLPDVDCAVVSEGYLGPNLAVAPSPAQLQTIRTELRDLYRDTLRNWARQLDEGAELALCVPAWRTAKGWQYLGVVDDLARLGYTSKVFKHVRTPLLYARHDQVVGRQLLLLRKN